MRVSKSTLYVYHTISFEATNLKFTSLLLKLTQKTITKNELFKITHF